MTTTVTRFARTSLTLAALVAAVGVCAADRQGAAAVQAKPQLPLSRDPLISQPQGPQGTGVIAGVIVAVDTGRPVRRARVSLSAIEPRMGKSTTTDDDGRFQFTDLPPGLFDLSASKPGFVDVQYGQKRPGPSQPGTPIRLVAAQRLERLSLAIPRGGVITGVVLDEQGEPAFGTPVRVLRYVIRGGERVLVAAGNGTADDRGMYRVPALPPGDYVVVATPRESEGMMMMMEDMARVEAVVSAKVASNAALQEMEFAKMARSVLSSPAADPASGYAPVYYPGTTTGSAAATVTIAVSQERSGVDMQLQMVPMARVEGTLISTDGPVPAGAQVTLLDPSQVLPGMGTRTARSGPDGRFSFTGVVPGQYTVLARTFGKGEAMLAKAPISPSASPEFVEGFKMAMASAASVPQLWAMADVSVDGRNPSNVTLTLRPGMSVSGSVLFEGAAPPPTDLTRLRVMLSAVTAPGVPAESLPAVFVDANGRFTVTGVAPGKYRVTSIGAPAPWALKSAVVAGRDALDFLLDVKPGEDSPGAALTFSDRSTSLSGTLQDAAGRPTADYTIVVFSSDPRFWTPQTRRIQATRPATDGRFSLQNLPPGDYRLMAVTDVEAGQWYDPAFLRQFGGGAMALTLADGEKKVQDLRVGK